MGREGVGPISEGKEHPAELAVDARDVAASRVSTRLGLRYEPRVVAFIDILGFRRMITTEHEKAIETMIELDLRLRNSLQMAKVFTFEKVSMRMFSDCICLSSIVEPEAVDRLFYTLSYLQMTLSMHGIFLRGGVSRGFHHESDIMIYSEGLIRAHDLERTAVYPRIVVDHEMLAELQSWPHTYWGPNGGISLLQAPDGKLFIDYLCHWDAISGESPFLVVEHRDSIIKEAASHREDTEVISKLEWLASYHNYRLTKSVAWPGTDLTAEQVRKLTVPVEKTFPGFNEVDGKNPALI